ncbi:hypothetical protein J2Y54_002918 [Sphingomonas sp. BE123]|uniref:hypothetical protein n=1 Tax=Sphingomonas sp. BE123 TaxID=2817842 RepID=UPI0028594BEB|nr:hypothetical protein [Sphingomonas sp. BE123]MDR6853398.1 hypothetical protein [Sphingomonas sp. BE123]
MNAFTAPEPAPYNPATFNHAAFHDLEPGVPDAQRYDGWTPEKQKRFLTALARGHNVTQACAIVGMARSTAYALRDSARGAAFALGWKAAQLRSRDCLADELMDRAFNGVRESVTGDDGRITTRHRYDNQLAWKMLNRLDKRADAACTDTDAAAVRLAAADFEQFLDLVEHSAAPGRAGLFLAARIGAAGVASEDDLAPIRTLARADRWLRTHVDDSAAVSATDLDPADRARWTDEQWRRAEAIGLVALASEAPPEEEADSPPDTRDFCPVRPDSEDDYHGSVWWCDDARGWRTDFPPPPGFDGVEEGDPLDDDYQRDLTDEEEAAVTAADARERAELIAAGLTAREAWLANTRRAAGEPDNPPPRGGGGMRSMTEGEEGNADEAPSNSSPEPAQGRGTTAKGGGGGAAAQTAGEQLDKIPPSARAAPPPPLRGGPPPRDKLREE